MEASSLKTLSPEMAISSYELTYSRCRGIIATVFGEGNFFGGLALGQSE